MTWLLTGGGGRLGRVIRQALPDIAAPSHATLDITDQAGVLRYVESLRPSVIVHAAAYTDVTVPDREQCWQVNVIGTRHVAQAARHVGAKLVHISTDYVFDGQRGHYQETDVPGVPTNYYGLTKLVAEEAARQAGHYLIIRTSFRDGAFPHPVAFTDLYTSQDYLDILAPQLLKAIRHAPDIQDEVLHIAGERQSAYDLALRRSPGVKPGLRRDAAVALPADISLDSSRWQEVSSTLSDEVS